MPLLPTEAQTEERKLPAWLGEVRELLELNPVQALALLQTFRSDDPRERVYAALLSAQAHYRQGELGEALSAAEGVQLEGTSTVVTVLVELLHELTCVHGADMT